MNRANLAALVGVATLLLPVRGARADEPATCTWKQEVSDHCGKLGCVVDRTLDPDLIAPGTAGTCQPCVENDECGSGCDRVTHECRDVQVTPVLPIRPSFKLLVVDATLGVVGDDVQPILGAGFVYQVAFTKTNPVKRPDGGWRSDFLPRWYLDVGGSAAFGGAAQNLFGWLGISYYLTDAPIAITTLSAGALAQRAGASVWDVADGDENSWGAGGYVSLSFLYNVTVRASVVAPLGGVVDDLGYFVAVVYFQDLLASIVPDRFQKYVPKPLLPTPSD